MMVPPGESPDFTNFGRRSAESTESRDRRFSSALLQGPVVVVQSEVAGGGKTNIAKIAQNLFRPTGATKDRGRPLYSSYFYLVLLFSSLLTIPLARQRLFHAAALAGFQIERMTLYFLNNVFLLNLTLKSAQRIFKRLAFLHANLSHENYTSQSSPIWVCLAYVTSLLMHSAQVQLCQSFCLFEDGWAALGAFRDLFGILP